MSNSSAAIELRPLSPYRCTDLGFSLARQWYWPLLKVYLWAFSPLIVACAFIATWWPNYLAAAQLVLWWSKPLGELALLFWCSQSLFGAEATLSSSVLSAYKSLPRLVLNYIGLYRLSPTRGLSLCVVFFEKTPLRQGGRRIDLLSGSGSALTMVLVVGAHVEFIIAVGLYLLLLYFIPFQTTLTENFADQGAFAFADYLESNLYLLCAFIAQIAFAPFFVCASFVHYINRRSRLEAWDIQHTFNAMRERISKEQHETRQVGASSLLVTLVMAASLALATYSAPVVAGAADDASAKIEQILNQDRFGYYSDSGRLQFKESDAEDKKENPDFDWGWLKKIISLLNEDKIGRAIYWAGFLFVGLLVFKLIRYLWPSLLGIAAALVLPRWESKVSQSAAKIVIRPGSFREARRLMLTGYTRDALSCLLRAVIDCAQHHQGVEILASYTETECEQEVARSMDAARHDAFKQLLQVWRSVAYERKQVSSVYADRVIDNCEAAFSGELS